MREFTISPDDFGIATASLDDLRGGSPEENADHLRAVLDGATGAYPDIVIMNAAVALMAGGHETDLATSAKRARHSLDTGQARNALDELVRITNSGA